MTEPQDIPRLVDQDESPYGWWRADQTEPDVGYMNWEPLDGNPDGRMRPLHDQQHETGSWWAGSGMVMRWMPDAPAPNPDPNMNAGENRDG